MKRWLTGAGLRHPRVLPPCAGVRRRWSPVQALIVTAACVLALSLAAPARALPVNLLSRARAGATCMQKADTDAALECWLKNHPDVSQAMQFTQSGFNGWYADWPGQAKSDFHKYFNAMVLFYKFGTPPDFPQPVPTPLLRQGPALQPLGGTWMAEAEGRTEYLLLAGNNIAAELTAAFPWSIATYSAPDLYTLLAMPEAFGYFSAPPSVPTPRYYFVGRAVPETPVYTFTFFKSNQLLGATATATVANTFVWARGLGHYSLEPNVDPADLYHLYWGSMAPPIAVSQLVNGTFYTGPSGPKFGHWTAGCGGTMEFLKSVLQAVNIPVKASFTGGHATPYFPTIGRALTHGDDPYDRLGWITPVPGFPTPPPSEYLASTAQLANLCDPNWPDPLWCEHKVGIKPAIIGALYGSDVLMKLHCQDLAAGKPHADSAVLAEVAWHWPEMTPAAVQSLFEALGMWTLLDAKVAATNFCS